jgi:hypothetical protein
METEALKKRIEDLRKKRKDERVDRNSSSKKVSFCLED